MSDLLDPTPGPPAPTPVPPATPTMPSRSNLILLIGAGVVLLALGVWLVVAMLPKILSSPTSGAPPAQSAAQTPTPAEGKKRSVQLFYVSDTGLELVPVSRDIPQGATPSEKARLLVEAQVHAPPEGFASAIPPDTTVRAVFLAPNGEAYVDLGPEIAAHHSGGALNEALAIYAIVNALTTNEAVTSVQILIDGKEVDTLAGHIDLRRPLVKSLDWVHKGK